MVGGFEMHAVIIETPYLRFFEDVVQALTWR